MARAAHALSVALFAALAAAAGPPSATQRVRRVHRDATSVEAAGEAGAGAPDAAMEAADLEMAEVAEVPAWRELWYGSLEALHREPSINNTQEDVLVQLGAVAFLHCPVRNLGERGVSWVRRRDWHIISSGLLMYTNDERFQVLHSEGSDDWILQIKYVQKRDNGTYECQVSTGGGTLSRLVHLHIAVPEAFILGADEHHVDAGSTINLVCIIEKVGRRCGPLVLSRRSDAGSRSHVCAESGAAAVRVLVPQRAHDQLRRGARRHRGHRAGAQDAVHAGHPRRRPAALRQLHVRRRQHRAGAHLRLRVRRQRQDGGHAEPQHVGRAARPRVRAGAGRGRRLPAARARRHMTLVH